MRELVQAGVVELVDTDGKVRHPNSVTLLLRGGSTRPQAQRGIVARLTAPGGAPALSVPSEHAS